MNIVGIISKLTATGVVKPLPLSGLGKEIVKAKGEKDKVKGYGRLLGYVVGGLVVWGLIFKGLAPDVAVKVLEILF